MLPANTPLFNLLALSCEYLVTISLNGAPADNSCKHSLDFSEAICFAHSKLMTSSAAKASARILCGIIIMCATSVLIPLCPYCAAKDFCNF